MAQSEARSDPRRPQEELKRVKKANPNCKTKKGPNQDDPKTVLDPPRVRNQAFKRSIVQAFQTFKLSNSSNVPYACVQAFKLSSVPCVYICFNFSLSNFQTLSFIIFASLEMSIDGCSEEESLSVGTSSYLAVSYDFPADSCRHPGKQ